jgi:hypothetical protein
MDLTDGYTFEDDNNEAILIMEVLCLAMQLRFEKRDVRKKATSDTGQSFLFGSGLCLWYQRSQTLQVVPPVGTGTALRAAGESQ